MNKKILIVDDDEVISDSMCDLLDLKSYDLLKAPNGVEGLKVCAKTKVDLIILDLNMPRMDGYMFMEKLGERWENDHKRSKFPKVLVMSAVDRNTDLGLATNLGATKFMSKPFKPAEFIATVEQLLEQE
jgi:DNA-binding response OmpR family regulator